MGVVRPTVLIVDDHEVFRASAMAPLQAGGSLSKIRRTLPSTVFSLR
jgi:hypothetical protein